MCDLCARECETKRDVAVFGFVNHYSIHLQMKDSEALSLQQMSAFVNVTCERTHGPKWSIFFLTKATGSGQQGLVWLIWSTSVDCCLLSLAQQNNQSVRSCVFEKKSV